jgi:hypothetical protein
MVGGVNTNHATKKLPTTLEARTSLWRRGGVREANALTKDAALRIEVLRRVKI